MNTNIQSIIDDIIENQQRKQIQQKIKKIYQNNYNVYEKISKQIRHTFVNESQSKININKLYAIECICNLETCIDINDFKTNTIYQLVAVTKGYMLGGQDIKGYFGRNLKRNSTFWGVSTIQAIYSALVNKSMPTITNYPNIKTRQYLWQFIKEYQQLIPNNFDIYQYAIKHMLMLRTDRKQEMPLFNTILDIFLKYPYNYQSLSKNFRFILQFFKTALTDKQIYFFPQSSALQLIKNYSNYQIDNIFAMGSLGLSWSQSQILNCINNVLKLGVTQQTYRMLKAFIEMFKNLKKYQQLIAAYQKNIHKIFIFLKFPQLYAPSLKTLKQFILGPWACSTLYAIFAPKAIQFSKLKNLKQNKEFVVLLACVVQKYKQNTLVNDLQTLVQANLSEGQLSPEKIRSEILQYDWRVFENNKKESSENKNEEDRIQNRGIVNIGNSCYLNSFLQCLFMTKQYRRKILQLSTLAVEKQVLTKLQQLYQNHAKQGTNLAMLARQTVRPLAQLQRTFSLLLKSKRQSINPTNIRNIAPIQFRNNHQHDSIQFGRFLIQTISKSVENMFQGKIATEIQCPYCGSKRQRSQQFLDLMLSSANQDVQTIQSMMKVSLQDQYIQNLKCQLCNNKIQMVEQFNQQKHGVQENKQQIHQKKQQNVMKEQNQTKKSIKRHFISKFPKYLILTLKRFQYNLKQNKNMKKQFKLQIQQQFKINQIQYLIYAIIVHRGSSANSGHYFVFSRMTFDPQINNWLCLNDSTVSKLQDFLKVVQFLSVNQQDTPYIIFCIQKKHWIENWKTFQQPITLRAPLQSFVQKDDIQFVKSMNKSGGKLDLSMLKFSTGNFMKRDDQDDPNNGMGGFNNAPIM